MVILLRLSESMITGPVEVEIWNLLFLNQKLLHFLKMGLPSLYYKEI